MPETIAEWVRMELKNSKRKRTEIAQEANISLSYFNKIVSGERVPPVEICVKLATSFGIVGDVQDLLLFRFYGAHNVEDFGMDQTVMRRKALPVAFTSFVGRDREVADVQALLSQSRFVTITGPGGVGKTRLALRVAEEVIPDFPDGVIFVPLEHIASPSAVLAEIGQRLGLKAGGKIGLADRMAAFLHKKQLLLVLDNFEHVIAAAPITAGLLVLTQYLKIIVTSRTDLHIHGEHVYTVPPLGLPDLNALPSMEMMSDIPAVALFLQRVQAIQSDFVLTTENIRSIATICVRLEGLPLAIELAAARVKLLPPQLLLERLTDKLTVLASSSRSLPLRQQTMRTCIAWSYDLLTATEQRLLQHLAVFSGGWTLASAETVCADEQTGFVLDGLSALLDQNLVHQVQTDAPEPRFTMLEIVRDYALEQLQQSEIEPDVWQRYLAYYVELARKTYVTRKKSAILDLDG